ncbi:hypothetical protein VP01_905g5 [Puccinia sorghi]|uniref:Uncharacterized protein n=1 Tax=Puccinia sorghi TaxID=27349 RepID=A0A0L6U9U4_9BASI|nr:hypothetical protein VP01_905g5 [Puccinia sorghi]
MPNPYVKFFINTAYLMQCTFILFAFQITWAQINWFQSNYQKCNQITIFHFIFHNKYENGVLYSRLTT